ncbi:c-type cytochrome [Roseibium sp. RKSG952]|uniref:c-type cytochrome n=1 Tax=Roseibium sp. RKSG952 TaxID=2529384 RepID=UPI0012BC4061|nr:c-type cytochrome [Roseibium sp. RKSG952]MTH99077.1 hypothetical protein [Roseibium sp. RKSG952]
MGIIRNGLMTIGALAVIGGVVGGGLAVTGLVNIKASDPHGIGVYNLLHFVFKRYVAAHSVDWTPPSDLSDDNRVALGAQHFSMVCTNCHGAPNTGQNATALSIRPRPQYLPVVVDEFTDSELFVILKYGVKFSAMPSWPTQQRDDDVWTMVSFVRGLDELSGDAYAKMTSGPQPPASANWPKPSYIPGTVETIPSDTERNSYPDADYSYKAPAMGLYDDRLYSDPIVVCAKCHGYDGTGAPTYGEAPNLNIQEPRYLEAALKAYASGERKSGFMQQVASELAPSQMTVLADYFANLPTTYLMSASQTLDSNQQAAYDRGEEIAQKGIAATNTPACISCHVGERYSEPAPILAGQNAPYLVRQLTQFRNGGRGNDSSWNPMMAESHSLTDAEIQGLAVYYSHQVQAQPATTPVSEPEPAALVQQPAQEPQPAPEETQQPSADQSQQPDTGTQTGTQAPTADQEAPAAAQ